MIYRLNIFLNSIPDSYSFIDDFNKAKEYHARHGVIWQATFHVVDVHGYTSVFNATKNRWLISGADTLLPLDNTVDANVFVFDQAEWSNPSGSQFPLKPNTPNGSCTVPQTPNAKPFVCIGTYPAEHTTGQTAIQIAHECMHSYVQNALLKGILIQDVMDDYIGNDFSDLPTTNFSRQWILLEKYFNSQIETYKWFSKAEVSKWQLKPELWQALDKMREIASTAFFITSGLRTTQDNKIVGGKPNSAHLRGLAVDLACTDNLKRTMMIKGILSAGIPCFLEIAVAHLHVDLDPSIHALGSTIVSSDE